MPKSGARATVEAGTWRKRGAPRRFRRRAAIDVINCANASSWKQFDKLTTPTSCPLNCIQSNSTDSTSGLDLQLWAYLQPPAITSATKGKARVGAMASKRKASARATTQKPRKRVPKPCMVEKGASATALKALDTLFGSSNGKSHLFTFQNNCTNLTLNRTHVACDAASHTPGFNSQYFSSTLEDCEQFCYAASLGSDFHSDIEEAKQFVCQEDLVELTRCPRDLLQYKCEHFFNRHGLSAKVRQLPVEGGIWHKTVLDRNGNAKDILCYPAYHFISRQRNHMYEQLMRGRTFLDTRYNSRNEKRNSRSPFALFELHDGIMEHVENLCDDLCDPDFSGIYISVSTKAFESGCEFGRVKRSKIIAWALIELLTSNERCMRSLWVHPSISAPATTTLLSVLIPYSIVTSFCHTPNLLDERFPIKTFYAWLNDFDVFPRQALILLTSFQRFGLIRHHDLCNDQVPNGVSLSNEVDGGVFTGLSHVDYAVTEKQCFCNSNANWEDQEHIIVGCTENLMQKQIIRWARMVPETMYFDLIKDLTRIVLPDSVSYQPKKIKPHSTLIRDAEFTGLSQLHIRSLLGDLYGKHWKSRLKKRILKSINEEIALTKVRQEQCVSLIDERDERRKRRSQHAGHM